MTKDEVTLFVMHATPLQVARLSAFIEGGCKPVTGSEQAATEGGEFITHPEAGELLGCSRTTVHRLVKEGEIEIAVIRNREKIVRASVLAYIERAKTCNTIVTKRPAKKAA